MEKRVDFLLAEIRKMSGHKHKSSMSDSDIVQFINDAQSHLQATINGQYGDVFIGTQNTLTTSGQTEIDLPVDILATNRIISLKVASEANGKGGTPIDRIQENDISQSYGYRLRDSKIILDDYFSSILTFKLVYARKLKKLDIRRGTVSSLSPLKIAGFGDDEEMLTDYICTVDRDGVQKDAGLAIDSFNPNSGKITLASGVSLTTTAIGDYVVIGKSATTHSELPDTCERYIKYYAKAAINGEDASKEIGMSSTFMKLMEQDIIDLFMDHGQDTIRPPITNSEYLV